MTRRDDVVLAIWDELQRHAPIEIRHDRYGTDRVRCLCQPGAGQPMPVEIWHRHIARLTADAASKLNDR